jgi:hypothetical protein
VRVFELAFVASPDVCPWCEEEPPDPSSFPGASFWLQPDATSSPDPSAKLTTKTVVTTLTTSSLY